MDSLESLKNKYAGKRIFVIGNGPSLSHTPLHLIENEYAIAMNRISLIYDEVKWRPNFFVCTTENIRKKEWHHDIMRSIDLNIVTFAWVALREYIGDRENIHYLQCDYGEEVNNAPPLDWWSNDITKGVCKFGTSMLVALQISVYLGFQDIYIIGADLGFKDSWMQKILRKFHLHKYSERLDKNHFIPSYGTPGLSADALNRNMIAAHKLANSATKQSQANIFNATLGGNLEVYPRVNIYDIFNNG